LRTAVGSTFDALKEGGRGASAGRSRHRLLDSLVVTQFALALMLSVAAGLLVRSFVRLLSANPGFRAEHVVTASVTLPSGRYTTAAQLKSFFQQAVDATRAIPGVQAAATTTDRPLNVLERRTFTPDPSAHPLPELSRVIAATWTAGSYFEALGIPLKRGRFFTDDDGRGGERVVILSEMLAKRLWPNQDPVGKRFKGQDRRGGNDDWLTVIGVVGDMRRHGLENQPRPHVFEWDDQTHVAPDLVVRTAGEPSGLAAALRTAVRSIEPGAVIVSIMTMEQQLNQQTAPRRFQTWLLGIFALLAVILAGVGIYGVMHYSMTQRTREIGVRMALGATAQNVLQMVLRQGFTLALIGVAAGLVGSWWLTGLLKSMLYAVTPTDPLTFIAVDTLLLGVALAATAVPAWRATRVDPSASLRHE